jgi:antitoxin HicB
MPEKIYSFTVIYEPAEEGGFIVTVPAMPGLVTEGDTIEEAREMAADAIRCYIASLQKDGEPIPDEESFRQEKISIPVESNL